jgi:hypothetical protein
VLQAQGLNAIGGGGGGLGYGLDTPGQNGASVQDSIAVKFDLHNNAGEGSNSTGLYLEATSPTVPATDLTPSGINLHNGHKFHVRLSYDGTNLTVSITDLTEYAVFTQSYPLNIENTVGVFAFPGFTAGTGDLVNTEKILNWTMTSY